MSKMSNFKFEKASLVDFDTIFEIMSDNFPSDEMGDYKEQRAEYAHPLFSCYKLENEKEICGFISVWKFTPFVYVEHFAIKKTYQGQNLGTEILTLIKEKYEEIICMEVEPPCDDFSKRRISFYERNDFFVNDFHYIQPPYSVGKNELELKIMSEGRVLTQKEFETLRQSIYKNVYKVI